MRTSTALFLCAVSSGAAWAQGISDPTRPPGGLAESSEAVGSGGPVLQSVMLSPTRKVAVISGEMVVLGGRYGSSRLVRLTETEAVLKNGADVTVLRLHPQVDKRAAGSGTGKGVTKTTK
jgi:MSHA biogenesis protein MshK